MSVIWDRDSEGRWAASPLTDNVYSLSETGLMTVEDPAADQADQPRRPVLRRVAGPGEQWVVIAHGSAGLRVNGTPISVGICVLSDRDEIVLPGPTAGLSGRFYFFSTERLARVEPFSASSGPATCPRCKQPIHQGDLAVRCPNPHCGIWHHQTDQLGCWTYSKCCTLCDTPTAMDGGFRWTPEEL